MSEKTGRAGRQSRANNADVAAYENKHELEARIAGLGIALRQSQPEAIAHIECVLGALLLSMEAPAVEKFKMALDSIETLADDVKETVQLFGEVSPDITVKSKRQAWWEELAALEAQLSDTPDAPLEGGE